VSASRHATSIAGLTCALCACLLALPIASATADAPLRSAQYVFIQDPTFSNPLVRDRTYLMTSKSGYVIDELALEYRVQCVGADGAPERRTFSLLTWPSTELVRITRAGTFTYRTTAVDARAGQGYFGNSDLGLDVSGRFGGGGSTILVTIRGASATSEGEACQSRVATYRGQLGPRRLFGFRADRACDATSNANLATEKLIEDLQAVRRLPSIAAARSYYGRLATANRKRVGYFRGLDIKIKDAARTSFPVGKVPSAVPAWIAARERRYRAIRDAIGPMGRLALKPVDRAAARALTRLAKRRDDALRDARRYAKGLGLRVCTRGDGKTPLPPPEYDY
jgi:hypothetical protein